MPNKNAPALETLSWINLGFDVHLRGSQFFQLTLAIVSDPVVVFHTFALIAPIVFVGAHYSHAISTVMAVPDVFYALYLHIIFILVKYVHETVNLSVLHTIVIGLCYDTKLGA